MFPRRYFGAGFFARRFFPQSQGGAPPVTTDNAGGVFRRPFEAWGRVFRWGAPR